MFSVKVNIVLTLVCVAPPANKMSNLIICVHCTLCAPLLGSGVERHIDISVRVHGPNDVVGEEGVGVLQPLVQQQLLCLHRPVLHDVL